ncbi:Uncharacterised protein [Bordetella pertussis]|nr:Uncharacterised protein [Bordetella pertussis]CPN01053.1 Uncharacterised protein [Bordetella pertussis]
MPASTPLTRNENTTTRYTGMPIRAARSRSCATARTP